MSLSFLQYQDQVDDFGFKKEVESPAEHDIQKSLPTIDGTVCFRLMAHVQHSHCFLQLTFDRCQKSFKFFYRRKHICCICQQAICKKVCVILWILTHNSLYLVSRLKIKQLGCTILSHLFKTRDKLNKSKQ